VQLGKDMTDDDMTDLYSKVIKKTLELVQTYDPLAVAAVMLAQSLSIYKSTLTQDDYDAFMVNLIERKDRVRTFNDRGTLH